MRRPGSLQLGRHGGEHRKCLFGKVGMPATLQLQQPATASSCTCFVLARVGGFLQLRLARTALHLRQPSELEMPYLQQVLKRIRKESLCDDVHWCH